MLIFLSFYFRHLQEFLLQIIVSFGLIRIYRLLFMYDQSNSFYQLRFINRKKTHWDIPYVLYTIRDDTWCHSSGPIVKI